VFLPLHDENPLRVIPFQLVTGVLIVACVAAYLWQVSLSDNDLAQLHLQLGLIPALLLGGAAGANATLTMVPPEATAVSSLFLHGGWLHLGANMAYLWVFGDNIEDAMGHTRFLAFYLLCGVIAGVTHAAFNPDSFAPLIGASGAVSGVLGAYVMLHPRVRILILAFNRFPLSVPAYLLLIAWLAYQLYAAVASSDSAIAWWAHIGGFVAGMILVVPFKRASVPLFDGSNTH
jgi:membrane associated rhomboid family serine protease